MPNQASISFTKKREKAETILQRFAKCENQGNSIPEIAGKAKIEGDKFSKVTNLLAEPLNSRDSPPIDWVTTRVKVSVASRASVSLPGYAIDLDFGGMKRVKTLVFSKDSKEGRSGFYGRLIEEEKNIFL